MNLFKRYEITSTGRPSHQSKTCIIHLGIDHKEADVHKQIVALKFMKERDQFLRELSVRKNAKFADELVLRILEEFDSDAFEVFKNEIYRKGFEEYPYCLVFPAGDKNLHDIISHEQIAGSNWDHIKLIAKSIAKALDHMHDNGFIHGDLKALNVMRFGNDIKLIDLDASAAIDSGYCGAKYSSAYCPPELVHKFPDSTMCIKSFEFDKSTMRSVKSGLPYELVKASPSYDAWSFGILLYCLCTGYTLFPEDASNSNMQESELPILYEFTDEFKHKKLGLVRDLKARNLISLLLQKDPAKRLSMSRVLHHPFLTGKSITRMIGQEAEYDTFISYRVNSDKETARAIYDGLKVKELKPWLDVPCLVPGMPWEDGFCEGLVKCNVFIAVMSPNAISNFSSLASDSPCDNVLLEHRLAIELRAQGLLSKIYPILIGDIDTNEEYEDFFKSKNRPTFSNAIVESVEAKLAYHLDKQGLGSPLTPAMSVSSIFKEITGSQGMLFKGGRNDCMQRVLNDIYAMVKTNHQTAV